ncbi:phage tail tip fiber protein, partial [Glaesserella parasuis]|uniref:phage tail tip fiber protein n=1 Tax=Glaesserella parasuis TaxID=738 RepID=UPI003B675BA9
NVGDWYQQQGLSAETGADIDAELALLNEKLSQNIIEEVFDTAMPARKLEMIKTVARIDNPTENIGHKQLYNEADGKLYIWDGNKYTAKVQAVDLEGKLASSQLDQALVNQLTQASSTANNALSKANTVQSALAQEATQRTQAIQAETRARTTAISAEATARTQALQAEANARGTAVSRLEQADREKAQLIATTTAKADNALSGLSEERQARIAADNAESQARTALTARVANTEGSVTTLSQSLSTHTRNLSEITQSLNSRVGGINLFSVVNANFVESLMHRLVTKTVISEKDEHFKLVIKDTGVFNIIIDNTLKAYFPTLKLGDKYVLSLEIKASKVGRLARIGVILGDYEAVSESRNVDVNLDWRVIEVPVVVSSIDQQLYQLLLLRFENWQVDDWAEIRNVQLQKGEKATAFSRSSLLTQAELTNHKSTQAEVDRVQSEQLVTHTARLGAAEATISSTSRTVTTLDGKVQSMHTIQAVSIAGNRKALAGISLGSNGGTESSVIVMADKFNVVKNARDGNVKPMFSVVNNKVAVNGDLIADGTISARMMGANSIAAGSIQGGAIRANHVAVGELTADKFAVGLGGNLLLNPIFANVNVDDGVPHGWAKGTVNGTVTFGRHTDKNYGLRSMGLPNENCIFIRRTDIGTTNYAELTQVVPVNRRMWYMASVYMGNHRCVKTELIIEYLNANGTAISATHKTGGNGFTGLETAERVFIKFQAPTNCEKVRFCLRQTGITARNTNALMLVARPMLEECTAHTRGPSPWQNSGVTAIHGGSIVTNTITAQQIATKTITADEIASKTLTADKLNINSLSAISANLGAVTAGSININNRFKVNTSGQVEMRSATANVGMVINNDQIVVYDEQGRVRVKIGRL